jgi:hypothetical protein
LKPFKVSEQDLEGTTEIRLRMAWGAVRGNQQWKESINVRTDNTSLSTQCIVYNPALDDSSARGDAADNSEVIKGLKALSRC